VIEWVFIFERVKYLNSSEKAVKIAETLYNKKAQDIDVLNITGITIVADYFVICTGTSSTQVKALADEIILKMGEAEENALRIEGYQSATWVLIDFGNVVVHIFQNETREFYNIERLWADAKKIDINYENTVPGGNTNE